MLQWAADSTVDWGWISVSFKNVVGDRVLASAARTATGNSDSVSVAGAIADVLVMVHCTAVSGTDTPTVTVSLEESADNSSWSAVANSSTAAITAVGNYRCSAPVAKNYVRVLYTISGTTPSLTFSVAIAAFAA